MKKGSLTYREISALLLEISMFLHSGSSASAALAYIADTEPQKEKADLYKAMSNSLDEGKPLYLAFADTKVFPLELVSMLSVADKTGRYEQTLSSMSAYYGRLSERDRALRSAFTYPSILLLVMAAVVVLLLVFVMPVFADVYASFGVVLGGFSGFLLSLGMALKSVWIPLALIFLALGAFIIAFFVSEGLRARIFGFDQRGVGKTAAKLRYARFSSALAMTLASGLALEEALECAGNVLGEKHKTDINKCIELLSASVPVHKALSLSGLLPLPEARLLSLGISGGSTDAAADQIAGRLDADADAAIENAVGKFEPVMVIAAAVLVGAILVSVMIPLANIMSVIG